MELDFSVATDFIAQHRSWTILLAFLVAFAESFAFLSILVPGTAILAACGALVPSGTLSAWELLAGAIPGAALGDSISYWLGRRYGPAMLRCWPLNRCPELVARAQAFMQRHGGASVALGRFFGPLRAVVPLLAGIAQMDRRTFWAANVGSAIVWAPVVMLPGAALGWMAEFADTRTWVLAGAGTALRAAGAGWLLRRRGRQLGSGA
jgi:membrane protein DedA with SNARE-associated domain